MSNHYITNISELYKIPDFDIASNDREITVSICVDDAPILINIDSEKYDILNMTIKEISNLAYYKYQQKLRK